MLSTSDQSCLVHFLSMYCDSVKDKPCYEMQSIQKNDVFFIFNCCFVHGYNTKIMVKARWCSQMEYIYGWHQIDDVWFIYYEPMVIATNNAVQCFWSVHQLVYDRLWVRGLYDCIPHSAYPIKGDINSNVINIHNTATILSRAKWNIKLIKL